MSELCLECLNKLNGKKESKWRYVISLEKDLCEECARYKRVVVKERTWSRAERQLTPLLTGRRRSNV